MATEHGGNPVRGPVNAWLLDRLDRHLHRRLGERKRRLFSDLRGPVLELGPGTGANFRYLPRGTKLAVVEPDPHVQPRLLARAQSEGIVLSVVGLHDDGSIDLPDASVGTVMASLVLCSVDDPSRVLSEIRRVLRPGGTFRFLEHVAAPRGTALHALQATVQAPWRWCFQGCHTTRPTHELLQAAGFADVQIEHYRAGSWILPIDAQISGIATV
jgi:SAM-dependent methyltransferase